MGVLKSSPHKTKASSIEKRTRTERQKLHRAFTQDVVQNPFSCNQEYLGYSSSAYNFRRTGARCLQSPPIRMFASFHPSANTSGTVAASLQSSEVSPAVSEVSPLLPEVVEPSIPVPEPSSPLAPSSSSSSEGCEWSESPEQGTKVLARRVTAEGSVEYLVEREEGEIF